MEYTLSPGVVSEPPCQVAPGTEGQPASSGRSWCPQWPKWAPPSCTTAPSLPPAPRPSPPPHDPRTPTQQPFGAHDPQGSKHCPSQPSILLQCAPQPGVLTDTQPAPSVQLVSAPVAIAAESLHVSHSTPSQQWVQPHQQLTALQLPQQQLLQSTSGPSPSPPLRRL